MTRMQYNWIVRKQLEPREDPESLRGISNFTGRVRGMHIFVGNFTCVLDFIIVEDISSVIDPRLSQVEHTQLVYFRNEEDMRRGVDYVMNKILGFYKECLELGHEYVTGLEGSGSGSSANKEGFTKGKGLLGPNGGSGGKFEGGFGENMRSCGGNGGRGGSIAGRGGGSKFMANGEECLDGWAGAGGGEVKGGGVDFEVSKTLLGEILGEIMGESYGEAFRVDGGAV
ncbi:hypothetical protein Tco_1209264 [Tanacetum coccineum]